MRAKAEVSHCGSVASTCLSGNNQLLDRPLHAPSCTLLLLACPADRQSSDWALGRAPAHEKSVCAVRARKVELPLLAAAAALLGGRPRPLFPSPSRRRTRVGTVSTICVAQDGQRQGLKVVFVATECGPW